MWQLVYAGLAGGRKGVPEQVAEHPQVFASLTAPSFGAVHSRPDDGRACRCGQRHHADDPQLGAALDPATYDYEGAVLWNWHAPALWNRFIIELVRVLAVRAGLSERVWRQQVRIAYAKVAEFQARGLVHFHAIVRLDGAENRATAPGVAITPQELCEAIREAAGRARLQGDAGDDETVDMRFGEQLHTRVLAGAEDGREMNPGQVAAYVAKYSCKASHEQITSRDRHLDDWRDRGVPEQLVQMAAAAIQLAQRPGLRGLAGWVHMWLPRALRHQVPWLLDEPRDAARRPRRLPRPPPRPRGHRGRVDPGAGVLAIPRLGIPQPRRRASRGRRRGLPQGRERRTAGLPHSTARHTPLADAGGMRRARTPEGSSPLPV